MSSLLRPPLSGPVLIVVATAGEAERLADLPAGLPARVVVCGVGPVAAALTTGRELLAQALGSPYALAVSAGIGGAYPGSGLEPGHLAVSSMVVQADLGAIDGPPGGETFLPLGDLGLSVEPEQAHAGIFEAWEGGPALTERLSAGGQPTRCGPALTLSTVTGSVVQAAALCARFPGALSEGMEGAGVAHAALRGNVPMLELRGISNPVGPRDRSGWRIPEALHATGRGLEELLKGG